MIIEDIYLYVCKRQFTGNTEVTIENPYESKIPTCFILGMVNADSYIGK